MSGRSFVAKFDAECASCEHRIKVGQRIRKRDQPALFERPKWAWRLRGQYRKVWYEHEDCEAIEEMNQA